MLELQSKIMQELARVGALAQESIARGSGELVDAYLRSTDFLGDAVNQAVASRLK